jgi:intracellular multiplication protein IcmM
MGKAIWNSIIQSKLFYVRTYRLSLLILVISMIVNMGLLIFTILTYLSRPIPDFYATSGVIAPIQLTALYQPNHGPNALLPPDPPTDDQDKPIPS